MVDTPKIYDANVTDTEQGVILTFSLDEGLEEINEQFLWCRARIVQSTYYQPLDLNIEPGGKTATAIIEPGKVHDAGDGKYGVSVEWYFEQYPSRERSELVQQDLTFTPDWFLLNAHQHETRSAFEVRGIELQAQNAAAYVVVSPEDAQGYPNAALNSETGLWMLEIKGGEPEEYAGIAPDQPDMGLAWLKAWFPQVLERSREIRTENGWDDGRNHA